MATGFAVKEHKHQKKEEKKNHFFLKQEHNAVQQVLFRCFCMYIASNDPGFVAYIAHCCIYLCMLLCVVMMWGKKKKPWHQCQPVFTVRMTTTTDLTRRGCSKVLHLCNHTLQSFLDRSALSDLLPRATSLIVMWSDYSSRSIEHC